ncbi:hypothetical protein SEA_SHAGRAT_111 [Rhodococcus phage Shagrat]|nr:hypothetical protein SEA_SHAGRAT_111 [Rhodococcus phage Shagrat]
MRFRVGSRLVQRPVLTGAGMSDSGRKHVDTFYFFMRACVRVRMRVYVYAISRFAFDSEHAKTPQPYSAGELRSPRISSSRRSWQRSHSRRPGRITEATIPCSTPKPQQSQRIPAIPIYVCMPRWGWWAGPLMLAITTRDTCSPIHRSQGRFH